MNIIIILVFFLGGGGLSDGTATFLWFLRHAKKVCLKYMYGKRLENSIYIFRTMGCDAEGKIHNRSMLSNAKEEVIKTYLDKALLLPN